jgi:hypothetical protein
LSDPELQRTWDLIVHLLGAGPPPVGAVNAQLVDEIVECHGLAAALGAVENIREDRLSPATRKEWHHASLMALGEAVWRFEQVRRVLHALAPIPIVVFKGFALAELIYPSPGGRLMGDVDLLIAPNRLIETFTRLRGLGFEATSPVDLERAHLFEWTFQRSDLILDVHRGFSYPARLRIDTSQVMARSLPWDTLGGNARLLSPEDAVLVQALQAPLAEFAPQAAPAMGAVDLRAMLKREGSFWGKVESPALDRAKVRHRASEWGASRLLYAGLRWLANLFPDGETIARDLLPELPTNAKRTLDARVVAKASPPRLATPGTLERMRRRWLLVEPRDRSAVLGQMAKRWAR